jgi:hypothetical protein
MPGEFEHRSTCRVWKGVAPWQRVGKKNNFLFEGISVDVRSGVKPTS